MAIHPQLPNAITLARIPLAIVFFVLLLIGGAFGDAHTGLRWTAAILFIVAISTDWVDGYLARKYEIVSDFGKLWDPIADKLLTGLAFVGLACLGEMAWWMVIVILIREWGVTVHRLMVRRTHVVAAAWLGKIKTAVQGVVLSWALLPLDVLIGRDAWTIVTLIGMWAVVVLTVVSGIDYVLAQVRGSRTSA
ncbi:CDP-diacylglycerol--glycerol-3-phosphate 3-phosphatidyltransferase [Microbacterium sorbitolivorans]|uniref:CDP-diacylglycerol--glycerol-3-phosphate 3-phosphatidyltransferase n=1 Tax=Microbacterium sorbitolivorans TaxID=1867410 RepID=A0A367XXL4_9MICO|nr:CDP-diacylglycerol--glycerol-3-phosphate 3-phosphatidyltransferase [Microbacterium sorbitolivorans]RCK58353.1 CDP-diacylglycerol--glycerol-3-phosphate 3-phosphatidyltransferase [Microbacterium sorbitolivorans]GGF35815.1 CDP-diacylglycerol--glycerol-3-phosphate 3-phosphatidyltransferase [Microbacterium sorbitolivorans]